MEFILFFLSSAFALHDESRAINKEKHINCDEDFLVEGFCYKQCPNGYEQQGGLCIKNTSMIFSLKFFSKIEFNTSNEENWTCYPETSDQSAPVTTENRGIFFKTSSNSCITKENFYSGPNFWLCFD